MALEEPATGRTLSGGHLRAGRALPGNGIELVAPPLWGIAEDLRTENLHYSQRKKLKQT